MKQLLPIALIERNKGQIEGLPKNPRLIRDQKFDLLVQSVKDDPELLEHRGLLVFPFEAKYITIGGNMRLEAQRKAGMTDVWCEILDANTPVEKLRAYTLKDNASFGEWDWSDIWSEWDIDEVRLAGIDIPEIDDASDEEEAEEDDFEHPEDMDGVQTDIKPGDVIELQKGPITHRLICGDSTKEADVTKLMNGRLADLVITDPPYNFDYQGGTDQKLKIMNDKMSNGNFRQFLCDAFKQMNAAMKPGAPFYIWHADSEGFNFRGACQDAGWKVRQCLIWVKNSLVMGRRDYQWKHEPCLYGWKEGAGHYFIDDRTNTTVVEEDKIDIRKLKKEEMLKLLEEIYSDKISTSIIHENKPSRNDVHPTMKPVRLFARHVKNSSKRGQIVLDTFAGSGTALVTCHQLGRNCYASEMDPKYAFIIIKRMKQLDNELIITCTNRIFDIEQEVQNSL